MENKILVILTLIFVFITIFNSYTIHNAITGRPVGTVSLTILPECTIGIKQGWNYVSLCAFPQNTSISSILSGLNYRYVAVWDESAQEFEIYSPRSASPSFDAWDANKSYFIYYYNASPTTLTIAGMPYNDLNLSQIQGWNPPTYPYLLTTNILKYLNSINDSYRYMVKWDYAPQEFVIYSPRSASPPFTTISQGQGQFILMTNADILEYNKSALGTP